MQEQETGSSRPAVPGPSSEPLTEAKSRLETAFERRDKIEVTTSLPTVPKL